MQVISVVFILDMFGFLKMGAELLGMPGKEVTVGRRVVINPDSDSFKSCFGVFCWIVNTPTKKTQKY
jgi:hypothetical protein